MVNKLDFEDQINTLLDYALNADHELKISQNWPEFETNLRNINRQAARVLRRDGIGIHNLPHLEEVKKLKLLLVEAQAAVTTILPYAKLLYKGDPKHRTLVRQNMASLVSCLTQAHLIVTQKPWFDEAILFKDENKSVLEDFLSRKDFYGKIDLSIWNAERNRIHFVNRDLSGLDLRGCMFIGKNFQNANFTKCNLIGSHFSDCHFTDTNFDRANLSQGVFSRCDFNHTFFEKTNVADTVFSHCTSLTNYQKSCMSNAAKLKLVNSPIIDLLHPDGAEKRKVA